MDQDVDPRFVFQGLGHRLGIGDVHRPVAYADPGPAQFFEVIPGLPGSQHLGRRTPEIHRLGLGMAPAQNGNDRRFVHRRTQFRIFRPDLAASENHQLTAPALRQGLENGAGDPPGPTGHQHRVAVGDEGALVGRRRRQQAKPEASAARVADFHPPIRAADFRRQGIGRLIQGRGRVFGPQIHHLDMGFGNLPGHRLEQTGHAGKSRVYRAIVLVIGKDHRVEAHRRQQAVLGQARLEPLNGGKQRLDRHGDLGPALPAAAVEEGVHRQKMHQSVEIGVIRQHPVHHRGGFRRIDKITAVIEVPPLPHGYEPGAGLTQPGRHPLP